MRPNNRLLNKIKTKKNESIEETRRKFKNSLREMKNRNKTLSSTVKVILGDAHKESGLPQETGLKFQINSLCLQLKELEKSRTTKPKVSRRKGIINLEKK